MRLWALTPCVRSSLLGAHLAGWAVAASAALHRQRLCLRGSRREGHRRCRSRARLASAAAEQSAVERRTPHRCVHCTARPSRRPARVELRRGEHCSTPAPCRRVPLRRRAPHGSRGLRVRLLRWRLAARRCTLAARSKLLGPGRRPHAVPSSLLRCAAPRRHATSHGAPRSAAAASGWAPGRRVKERSRRGSGPILMSLRCRLVGLHDKLLGAPELRTLATHFAAAAPPRASAPPQVRPAAPRGCGAAARGVRRRAARRACGSEQVLRGAALQHCRARHRRCGLRPARVAPRDPLPAKRACCCAALAAPRLRGSARRTLTTRAWPGRSRAASPAPQVPRWGGPYGLWCCTPRSCAAGGSGGAPRLRPRGVVSAPKGLGSTTRPHAQRRRSCSRARA